MPEALFQARNGFLAVVICLAVAVFGISIHWVVLTAGTFLSFEGLGIVAGGLTALVLGMFLVVGVLRKNATLTAIGVELPVLAVLSILFIAEGALTGDIVKQVFPFGCIPVGLDSSALQICKELNALKSLSFAIFGIMAAYWVPLLFMVVIGLTQGQNAFRQSVREVTFSRHTQAQANVFANGFMEQIGLKESHQPGTLAGGEMTYEQQQQLQLQQLQLQQLQQQQAMLQQQQQQQQQPLYTQQGLKGQV